MFDIAWSELALIAAVALIVIGPKDLPRMLYTLGKWTRRARAVTREFQGHIDQMMREAELDELQRQAQSLTNLDIGREIENHIDPEGELRGSLAEPMGGEHPPAVHDAPAEGGPAEPGAAESGAAEPGHAHADAGAEPAPHPDALPHHSSAADPLPLHREPSAEPIPVEPTRVEPPRQPAGETDHSGERR